MSQCQNDSFIKVWGGEWGGSGGGGVGVKGIKTHTQFTEATHLIPNNQRKKYGATNVVSFLYFVSNVQFLFTKKYVSYIS